MAAIRKQLNEKAQGLVEYVIILAFVAGVAVMLNGAGIRSTVVSTFDKAVEILAMINGNESSSGAETVYGELYKKSFLELSQVSLDDVRAIPNEERLAMDMDAMQKIANWFMGKDKETIKATFWNNDLTLDNNSILWIDERSMLNNSNELSRYYTNQDIVLSEILGVSTEGNNSGNTWTYSANRYFYSDSMIYQSKNEGRQIRVHLEYDANDTVTSSHVYVTQVGSHPDNDTSMLQADGQ